jgi:hypothetical protein
MVRPENLCRFLSLLMTKAKGVPTVQTVVCRHETRQEKRKAAEAALSFVKVLLNLQNRLGDGIQGF